MYKTIYKLVTKLTVNLLVLSLMSGCFEKDEYESLKAHDKNNNKIIDEFEEYVKDEISGDDVASQDLRHLLYLYAENFYNIINDKNLDVKKSYYYSDQSMIYSNCIGYLARKSDDLKKYEVVSEYNNLNGRVIITKLVVSKEIYKKRSMYNGFLHGKVMLAGTPKCNLKLKGNYE